MATSSAFASASPKHNVAQLTAANTNRDGTGTIVDLATGASGATQIQRVSIKATGTTTAGMIRFYYYDGTNSRMILEVNVSALTPSGTVQAFAAEVPDLVGMMLENAEKLQASTHNAETFNVHVETGDF